MSPFRAVKIWVVLRISQRDAASLSESSIHGSYHVVLSRGSWRRRRGEGFSGAGRLRNTTSSPSPGSCARLMETGVQPSRLTRARVESPVNASTGSPEPAESGLEPTIAPGYPPSGARGDQVAPPSGLASMRAPS
jgi:hypothetical protein